MLFDLRGRGRRRTVQVIYLTLALLMGGGLVFFGIGGNTSGGLLDAFNGGGGGGGNPFKSQVKAAERAVAVNPSNAPAWARLARLRYSVATTGDNYNRDTNTFTGDGKAELRLASSAWQRYLALNPKKPDDAVAGLMLQVYGPVGLNDAAKAAQAAEVITEVRPTFSSFYQLAVYAYQAGQSRKGDLAAEKSVSLAPKAERATLRERLKEAKQAGSAGSSGTGATTTVPTG